MTGTVGVTVLVVVVIAVTVTMIVLVDEPPPPDPPPASGFELGPTSSLSYGLSSVSSSSGGIHGHDSPNSCCSS